MVESVYPMISPDEAYERVVRNVRRLLPMRLPIDDALGHVLAADVIATENMPRFRSSTMDGYAVVAADHSKERKVLGEQDAGHLVGLQVGVGTAVQVMTGSAVPEGADAVIPVEYAVEHGQWVGFSRLLPAGANIRPVGQDLRAGERVLAAGLVLGAAEIGLLATMGCTQVKVYPRPRVAILATGDELVPPGQPLDPGQIRDSNSHALAASVRQFGAEPISLGIVRDDEGELREAILQGLRRADMLLTSGGVSMGRRDLIKPILEGLGEVHFGRVAQKPGKPTTFATVKGKPVFGLPGFPVSSLISTELYVRPALLKMAGFSVWRRREINVLLEHDIHPGDPGRTEFQRALVTWRGERALARNTGDQASSRLRSLVGANALLRLPQGVAIFQKGDQVQAILTTSPGCCELG